MRTKLETALFTVQDEDFGGLLDTPKCISCGGSWPCAVGRSWQTCELLTPPHLSARLAELHLLPWLWASHRLGVQHLRILPSAPGHHHIHLDPGDLSQHTKLSEPHGITGT